MPKTIKLSLLAVSVALVLTLFLGVNVNGVRAAADVQQPQQQDGAYRQISVYSEVLQHVQSEYVVDPNIPAVTDGALRGLLESLDADSSYLTPADYRTYKADKGGKAQVGIHVSKRFGYATVVSVVPGSPADKANIVDGDILEAIGDKDTRDLSLAMIQLLLQGTPGSELQLSVIRPRKADPDKVKLDRVMISEPPVSDTVYENATILDLRPMSLDHEHVQQLEGKLRGMQKAGNKKILLDLRDVSTGDMAEGVRLANFFLKQGTIATLEGQKVPKQTFTADATKTLNATAPLVVLVNRGTSGAAELVAAALAENKRGDLVGEKTFGEGAQQKTFELADGGALILSVAKYASPNGKKFEDEAVTPGIAVASNLLDSSADDDGKGSPSHRSALQADDQLSKGLDLLKAKPA